MKRIACLAFALFVAGCSTPSLVCETTDCSSGGKTYQVCDQADGSVEYKFGGMSCNCIASNQSGCMDCEMMLATYCGS